MQKKLPFEWVKTIKKHMDRLKAAECFGDFLKLRLGKPEQLEGCESIRYSLHVAANFCSLRGNGCGENHFCKSNRELCRSYG